MADLHYTDRKNRYARRNRRTCRTALRPPMSLGTPTTTTLLYRRYRVSPLG